MSYATGTEVSVQKTRIEIEELLRKWKCERQATMLEPAKAVVYFQVKQWHVQFTMPLPTAAEAAKQRDKRSGWRSLTTQQQERWLDQRHREKWRALLLTIKAKLVSVESGVESFEEAFLAHLVLPGGETVGQKALPAIAEAVKSGKPPVLMLGSGSPS